MPAEDFCSLLAYKHDRNFCCSTVEAVAHGVPLHDGQFCCSTVEAVVHSVPLHFLLGFLCKEWSGKMSHISWPVGLRVRNVAVQERVIHATPCLSVGTTFAIFYVQIVVFIH